MKLFQQEYVSKHEVVKPEDKKYFSFFAPDKKYKVSAQVYNLTDSVGFIMKTSGYKTPRYFKYALLQFKVGGKTLQLTAYKNEQLSADSQYKNMLFIPFTDVTNGKESYGGGRYLEIYNTDIKNNQIELDFNKAYNPYCTYTSGYNCPIPPAENNLPIKIKAGEKNFGKPYKK